LIVRSHGRRLFGILFCVATHIGFGEKRCRNASPLTASVCEWNVTVSSRTPEGMPTDCPLCGAKTNIEFSDPAGDALCPNCGHLLWASAQLLQSVIQMYANALGTAPDAIHANTRFNDLGADSLDTIEMVMELEEECDVSIPPDVAERIQTVGDAVRYIEGQRRGMGD